MPYAPFLCKYMYTWNLALKEWNSAKIYENLKGPVVEAFLLQAISNTNLSEKNW